MRISTAGVIRKNGKVFVALRNPGTSIGESWEFPGGKLEEGESPSQGLIREFKEEFNLDVAVKEILHESYFFNKEKKYHLMAFDVEVLGGEIKHPEHQEARWVTLSELSALPMAPSDKAILQTLQTRS